MKKVSKNLGVTKSCPECKKTIIKSANFLGTGTFNIKCPHCGVLFQIEIKNKLSMNIIKVVLSLLVVITGMYFYSLNQKIDTLNKNVSAQLDIIQGWDVTISK